MADHICKRCNTEMYMCSNGFYECRNFDCPPGTQAKYQHSWRLKDKLRPLLLKQPARNFTVEELIIIIEDSAEAETGPAMERMAKRLGLVKEAERG